MATVGLRVEPGPVASGVQFRLDVDQRSVPLYIYKTESLFIDHMTAVHPRALLAEACTDGKSPIAS